MGHRPKRKAVMPLVLLSLLLSPAVSFAAGESETAEPKQSEAAPESKSYLPPWMQKQEGVDPKAVAGTDINGTSPEKSALAEDPEAAKKKAKATSQGRERRSWRSNNVPFFGSFVGLFGRR
jgi:hypothetical protein